MKKIIFFAILFFAFAVAVAGADNPGVPRDSNFNNTGGYDGTRVEAHLRMEVKDGTDEVHFIRDNNDPRVVTKTYEIKNVDAYDFRDYLRQMVQAKRVGNTSLQQIYPGNTAESPYEATASSVAVTTPVSAQTTYSPSYQLGSNTAVECLKYVDGTGLLLVSAEEYRFKDQTDGMGLDSLVEFLDKPQMGAFLGTQTFFYVPKFVPARNLLPLIENVGMNVSDVTELWQGMDLVAEDTDLNWLVFDVTNYSMPNIERMLALYDVPIPQVRMKVKVYEISRENDQRLGLDFQAWKNNEGADFFSAGGRYRDNWSASYNGGIVESGSERTSYYNFNPKWNTRYLDLLAAHGKAHVNYEGELVIRNNSPASLERQTEIFYVDTTTPAKDALTTPDAGIGPYKLLSDVIARLDAEFNPDVPVAKANQAIVTKSSGFGFSMKVANASVNPAETHFDVTLQNTSLLGFESTGAPRISDNGTISVSVSLPHGKDSFVIGGLRKQEVVKSMTGIPYLCEIPVLKYVFGTEGKSVKTSELIVVGECIFDVPSEAPHQPAKSRPITL